MWTRHGGGCCHGGELRELPNCHNQPASAGRFGLGGFAFLGAAVAGAGSEFGRSRLWVGGGDDVSVPAGGALSLEDDGPIGGQYAIQAHATVLGGLRGRIRPHVFRRHAMHEVQTAVNERGWRVHFEAETLEFFVGRVEERDSSAVLPQDFNPLIVLNDSLLFVGGWH